MPLDPAIEQHFTEELKADPVVSQFYEKGDYKDVPSVMKGLAHAQKRLGSVVPLLNGDAKPEEIEGWRKEHLPKLINAKLIDAPRQVPEKYEIKRPDGLPEGAWNEGLEQEAQSWAKKHGLSQEALSEGFGLYMKSFTGFGEAVKVNREAMATKVKEWAASEGITLEEVDSALDRFNKDPNGWDVETAEMVSKSGFADHPLVVKAIYKLIKDSGVMDTRDATTGATEDAIKNAQVEINDIRTNPDNPRHAKFYQGDPEVTAYVESLYKKLVPPQKAATG